MPRRVRIELAGFHHVYNRAVEKKYILQNLVDKDKFLEILNEVCEKYKLTVHSYCIMDNHYHLLLENSLENLSLAMRQLNSKYATYYNKKYKRVGHLWQGRFKSWYVLNENYLYILYKYIESNPVSAKMTSKIGKYKYSSSYTILNNSMEPCIRNSFILRNFSVKELAMFLSIPLNSKEVKNINSIHKEKVKIVDNIVVREKEKSLGLIFHNINSKEDRNKSIVYAFMNGYKQSEISRYLEISSSSVSKILKEYEKSGDS